MPLPLFIAIAATTGVVGAGKTVLAVSDDLYAKDVNKTSNELIEKHKKLLELQRVETKHSLENLGNLKFEILGDSIHHFVESFEKLKNVDFHNSVGLDELNKMIIDKKEFEELKELGNMAFDVVGGAAAGVTGGACTALAAYGAAEMFACASTGTAISSLSGAAATNATLAFFGGGSLASGGLGMSGGVIVLGGLVAGPALLVMGLITGVKAQEKLDNALANEAQAKEIVEALKTSSIQCSAIRKRTNMFYNLLSTLDAYLLPLVYRMDEIIEKEGTDYSKFSDEIKDVIISAASNAGTVKAILDTPILEKDGSLTNDSKLLEDKISELIYK